MTELDLTPAARADLVAIRIHSQEQFGGRVADTYFKGFDDAVTLLRDYPLAGTPHPELGDGLRSLTHRKHRIFYRADADLVLIIRIVHHAMDARRVMQ